MDEREIREAIEACRPGSEDLLLPEMEELARLVAGDERVRELYERTQQCDSTMAAAFHDVPVPDGLEARLLAAAAASERLSGAGAVEAGATVEGDECRPARVSLCRVAGNRLVWFGAAAIAAVVLLAVSVTFRLLPEARLSRGQIVDAADRWLEEAAGDGLVWSVDFDSAALAAHGPPSSLRARPSAWCGFSAKLPGRGGSLTLDEHAVLYDLRQGLDERRAVLFVIRTSADLEAPTTPRKATRGTAGWLIGVWREQDRLYVLAVEGDMRRYRDLLKPLPSLAIGRSATPLAA